MSKFASLILAVSFSFFLFVGMTYLIKPKALDIGGTEPRSPITITFKVIDEKPDRIKRIIPQPVVQPKPELVTTPAGRAEPSRNDFHIDRVAFVPHKDLLDIRAISNMGKNYDGEATPRVRINPTYPPKAQRNGIEGFVTLRFDISELGHPINVSVVKSDPRGIFEKQARRALRKWKYDPKMVDEKAVIQTDQTVTLAFEFEKESGLL